MRRTSPVLNRLLVQRPHRVGSREHRMMDKAAAEALAQCPVNVGIDESGRAVGGTADVDYVWTLN